MRKELVVCTCSTLSGERRESFLDVIGKYERVVSECAGHADASADAFSRLLCRMFDPSRQLVCSVQHGYFAAIESPLCTST